MLKHMWRGWLGRIGGLGPQQVFAGLAGCAGLILVFVTPPFEAPDEYNHFYRAYQVSEGQFISTREDQRVGGSLPRSLQWIAMRTTEGIPFDPLAKMSGQKFRVGWDAVLNPNDRIFVDFNNTALMSFVPYAHQAVAIAVGRVFTDRPLLLAYLARLSNLVLWSLAIYAAIRIIPFGKWMLLSAGLMPTNLFLGASMSYDAFTNAAAFLLLALALRLSVMDGLIGPRHLVAFALVAVGLVLAKFAYVPLVLLFLLIPPARFAGKATWLGSCAGVFLVSLLAWGVWAGVAASLYIPYEAYHAEHREACALVMGVDPAVQLTHVLGAPHRFVATLVITLVEQGVLETMVARLGWLDTRFPLWFSCAWLALLLATAAFSSMPGIRLSFKARALLLVVVGLTVTCFHVLLYLQWTPVGNLRIHGVQGRYLIPVLPVFLAALARGRGSTLERSPLGRSVVIMALIASCALVIARVVERYYLAG